MDYSLFLLERNFYPQSTIIGEFRAEVTEKCFEYLDTYNTLEEAKIAQKKIEQKSLILQSY
jgi:hypothetical protein